MVIYILIIIIIILLAFIILMLKDLKYISAQIKDNLSEYKNLKTKTSFKYIDELASSINLLYEENQKINVKSKNIEEELKTSVTNMSHDLRTPLTSIIGYMQLIKSDNISCSDKNEYISIIEKRTKTLQNLINNFYDLSRIQSDEYKFNFEKVNIQDVLCENIALFYNDFIVKNIDPIIDIDDNMDSIISDKNALNRIFSNLINNSLKYGEKYVKISFKKENNYIISEFINYAPSLKEDDCLKIFNRFYTGNNSRTNETTGIGLSIVKSFTKGLGASLYSSIENHNLKITIKWELS